LPIKNYEKAQLGKQALKAFWGGTLLTPGIISGNNSILAGKLPGETTRIIVHVPDSMPGKHFYFCEKVGGVPGLSLKG
jgi:hypothetical protein